MSYHNQTDDKNRIYAILQSSYTAHYYDYTFEFNRDSPLRFGKMLEKGIVPKTVEFDYLFYHKYHGFIYVGNQKIFNVSRSFTLKVIPIGLDLKVYPNLPPNITFITAKPAAYNNIKPAPA